MGECTPYCTVHMLECILFLHWASVCVALEFENRKHTSNTDLIMLDITDSCEDPVLDY